MNELVLIAPCLFGVEKMVSREIKDLGFEIIKVEDGRVTFKSDLKGICLSNIWIRSAERVLLQVAQFKAQTFEELFQGTKKAPWSDFIHQRASFPVSKAASINSKLFSVSDIQSIVKKAVVEKLKSDYNIEWFKEDEEIYPIHVFLNKDIVTISIDTTGDALHKRGYRERGSKAPIRETLASSLVALTPFRLGRTLIDPFCGSGTILIEAAMMALNMAPGINREFLSEKWTIIDKKMWWDVRKDAFDLIKHDDKFKLYGYDIDKNVIDIAKENAAIAGVEDYIEFEVKDFRDMKCFDEYGFIITNPPYGERLEDKEKVTLLYKDMGKVFSKFPTWSKYIITSFEEFEEVFGRVADKKRKLYNGMLKSNFYQYPGPKPPKNL